MARGRDGGAPRRRTRGLLRHYDRPLWRDPMFWVVALPSVVATAVIVPLLLVLWGVPESAFAWVRIVVLGLIVLNLAFRVLGFSLVTTRHFQRGLGEGSAKRDGDWEDKGRAAGAVVGKAIASTRKASSGTSATSSGPPSSDDPLATPSTPAVEKAAPTTKETVDKAARVAGGMVGRRLAERRRKQG
jgi:hypothetical protein